MTPLAVMRGVFFAAAEILELVIQFMNDAAEFQCSRVSNTYSRSDLYFFNLVFGMF